MIDLSLKEKFSRYQFQTIYNNFAEIERTGIKIKDLSFDKLKIILVSEYRVPKEIHEGRYTAMCKSIANGHTIYEDRW